MYVTKATIIFSAYVNYIVQATTCYYALVHLQFRDIYYHFDSEYTSLPPPCSSKIPQKSVCVCVSYAWLYYADGSSGFVAITVCRGKPTTSPSRLVRALESLKEGLRDPAMAFIYHCYNHYFCPIGYEEVPKNAIDAYK